MLDADLENLAQADIDTAAQPHVRDLDSAEPALEVIVMWGEQSVLHVAHLSPPRAFYVGAEAFGPDAVDFLVGEESLGAKRMPIALHDGEQSFAVIPAGAGGYVTSGDQLLSFEDLAARGLLAPCDALGGAVCCRLTPEMSARVEHRGFCFLVRPTLAARRIGVSNAAVLDWSASRFTVGSVVLHLCLLMLFYFAPPRSSALAIDRLDVDSRLVNYLVTPDETVESEPDWSQLQDAPREAGGDPGQRERGDEGRTGKRDAPKTKRGAVGAGRETDPAGIARSTARELLQSQSIVGILQRNAGADGDLDSVYGRASAMLAEVPAVGTEDGFGLGGTGMIGTGRHGGGNVIGAIGVGTIGTIGVGGLGADGTHYGTGLGPLSTRVARVPRIRSLPADIRGSLSKEAIRRAVQLHLSEVRYCYQQALQVRPELQGRVAVKFLIAPTGEVSVAARAGSDLNEPGVEACIVNAVKRWTFPAPEGGGVVMVTYPFVLQQAGD